MFPVRISTPPECRSAMPFDTSGMDRPDGPGATDYYRAAGLGDASPEVAPPDSEPIETMPADALLAAALEAPKKPGRGVLAAERFLARYPRAAGANRARLHLARSLGRGASFARAASLVEAVKVQRHTRREEDGGLHFRAHRKQQGRQGRVCGEVPASCR